MAATVAPFGGRRWRDRGCRKRRNRVPDWTEIRCRFPAKSGAAFDRNRVPDCSDFCILRLLALFGESLQVVTSPCCPRQLPDVISNSLFLDAGSPTPAVHRVLAPVSST